MKKHVSMTIEAYRTESGRSDTQGGMEKEDVQVYRRQKTPGQRMIYDKLITACKLLLDSVIFNNNVDTFQSLEILLERRAFRCIAHPSSDRQGGHMTSEG